MCGAGAVPRMDVAIYDYDQHSDDVMMIMMMMVGAGAASRVDVAIYDYAEHSGEALAWTPPKPEAVSGGRDGQLLYTHLKQSALFRGDAHSHWCALALWKYCLTSC
jgi:hypothetical protein